MSLLLPLCFAWTQLWACCYPSGHPLFYIPSFLPLFLPTGVVSAALGSWISCPRQQSVSRVALGKKGEHSWVWERVGKILLWAARSCCVTSLISSRPTLSLFSLSVAERSSSISLLPVLELLLLNPWWLRAKLIYTEQVKTCNLCPGAAGEDWGCVCQLLVGQWPLWALVVAAPVPSDCWSGRDSVGTCKHTSPSK